MFKIYGGLLIVFAHKLFVSQSFCAIWAHFNLRSAHSGLRTHFSLPYNIFSYLLSQHLLLKCLCWFPFLLQLFNIVLQLAFVIVILGSSFSFFKLLSNSRALCSAFIVFRCAWYFWLLFVLLLPNIPHYCRC